MTEPAARLGDICTGHKHAYRRRPIVGASPNTRADGVELARLGDPLASHGCSCGKCPAHKGKIASGAPSVQINKRRAARINDVVSCGGAIATGSARLLIGNAALRGDVRVHAPLHQTQAPSSADPPHALSSAEAFRPAHLLSYLDTAGGKGRSEVLVTPTEGGGILPLSQVRLLGTTSPLPREQEALVAPNAIHTPIPNEIIVANTMALPMGTPLGAPSLNQVLPAVYGVWNKGKNVVRGGVVLVEGLSAASMTAALAGAIALVCGPLALSSAKTEVPAHLRLRQANKPQYQQVGGAAASSIGSVQPAMQTIATSPLEDQQAAPELRRVEVAEGWELTAKTFFPNYEDGASIAGAYVGKTADGLPVYREPVNHTLFTSTSDGIYAYDEDAHTFQKVPQLERHYVTKDTRQMYGIPALENGEVLTARLGESDNGYTVYGTLGPPGTESPIIALKGEEVRVFDGELWYLGDIPPALQREALTRFGVDLAQTQRKGTASLKDASGRSISGVTFHLPHVTLWAGTDGRLLFRGSEKDPHAKLVDLAGSALPHLGVAPETPVVVLGQVPDAAGQTILAFQIPSVAKDRVYGIDDEGTLFRTEPGGTQLLPIVTTRSGETIGTKPTRNLSPEEIQNAQSPGSAYKGVGQLELPTTTDPGAQIRPAPNVSPNPPPIPVDDPSVDTKPKQLPGFGEGAAERVDARDFIFYDMSGLPLDQNLTKVLSDASLTAVSNDDLVYSLLSSGADPKSLLAQYPYLADEHDTRGDAMQAIKDMLIKKELDLVGHGTFIGVLKATVSLTDGRYIIIGDSVGDNRRSVASLVIKNSYRSGSTLDGKQWELAFQTKGPAVLLKSNLPLAEESPETKPQSTIERAVAKLSPEDKAEYQNEVDECISNARWAGIVISQEDAWRTILVKHRILNPGTAPDAVREESYPEATQKIHGIFSRVYDINGVPYKVKGTAMNTSAGIIFIPNFEIRPANLLNDNQALAPAGRERDLLRAFRGFLDEMRERGYSEVRGAYVRTTDGYSHKDRTGSFKYRLHRQ